MVYPCIVSGKFVSRGDTVLCGSFRFCVFCVSCVCVCACVCVWGGGSTCFSNDHDRSDTSVLSESIDLTQAY